MCLRSLLRGLDRDVKEGENRLELRSALVQERNVLQLRPKSLFEISHEAVKIRMEDDELPKDMR